MKVDNGRLLIEKIKTGICLFTGAGFSILPNAKGERLPTGSELAKDLCEQFGIEDIYSGDLSYISNLCPKTELDAFLRKKFTVTEYNPLYNVLNKVNLKTFVTTNIDNIIRLVVDNSKKFYLSNMKEFGAPTNKTSEVCYIPLHGDVKDINSELYFGKMELAQVSYKNKELFDAMYVRLKNQTTVFIGYSFNDNGVLEIVSKLLDEGNHDIWVQCLENDQKNITYFRALGCNIIEGDTESFLRWIDAKVEADVEKDNNEIPAELSVYKIPSLSDVIAIDSKEYFAKGYTDWYPIMTRQPYERKEVNQIYNYALSHAVLILGDRFTGKTTMLMQVALKVDSMRKLFLDYPRLDEAKLIVKHLKNNEAWVFLKECTSDVDAFLFLASQPNIHVIGTSSDYQYESIRHLIEKNNIKYKCVNISELTKEEAVQIFNKVPIGIRKNAFMYKHADAPNEKYSMFEFVGKNINYPFTERKVKSILDDLLAKDKIVFDVIALTSYLSRNYSAFSCEVLSMYLNTTINTKLINIIKRANEYLRFYGFNVSEDYYYVLRSKIFAMNIQSVLKKDFRHYYGEIIEKFLYNMNPYYILQFNAFRRSAFDANMFYDLYTYEKSMEIFDGLIYHNFNNYFIFQQRALCQARYGRFKEAFADVDYALGIDPNNYSIRNTQAIILFEANKKHKTQQSLDLLKSAMNILRECFQNDKRKIYHAQKYAEFALYLHRVFNCSDYLDEAKEWLYSITEIDGTYLSSKTRQLLADLEKLT